MAGSASDYLEAKFLNLVYGLSGWTPPSTMYFALFLSSPGDSAGGLECSAGNYSRTAITNNVTNWSAASGTSPTTKNNATAITTAQDATADWGTVVSLGFYDASSGGNLISWSDISPTKLTQIGDTLQVAASGVAITMD